MSCITIDDLCIYPEIRRVEVKGRRVKLAPNQWKFLLALALCAGGLVTRDFLLALLHPNPAKRPNLQSINVIACRVRKKLAKASRSNKEYIRRVWQSGYALNAPTKPPAHTRRFYLKCRQN